MKINYKPVANNMRRDVFYKLKNDGLSNIKNIMSWADDNGVLTKVTMLDFGVSFSRIESDKDFGVVLNLIDEGAKDYFVIISRRNMNLFGILYNELVVRDMLEIGIRGIDVDSKEYFIMIYLEKEFLDELKQNYELEAI
ncbi:MAG: hypothetical protein U9Q68_05365 [Euryarchaeota archaeon]|nr:hypothetical protein [Euryarchaeota archaeon]